MAEPAKPKSLRDRSIHELRGMAQAFGINDIFEKDAAHLIQEIELKQQTLAPARVVLPPLPQYDARLMTKPPSKRSMPDDVVVLLEPYIEKGLRFSIDENAETWTMQHGLVTDTGTMRMPMRHMLDAARRVMG